MRQAQPGLPAFEYECPDAYEDVYEILAKASAEAVPFMGGTDLFVQMRDGARKPHVLVDLKTLPGLKGIDEVDGGFLVGAATTLNQVGEDERVMKKLPMLCEAIEAIASYQLRNRATIGGNLCNASPAADTAPSLLVLEAVMVIVGPDGERKLPIGEYFKGPGKTALKAGEILKAVFIPVPPKGYVGTYQKLGRNASGDLAIVGVAGLMLPDKDKPGGNEVRLALASVAPTPIRVPAAEELLAEKGLSEDTIKDAAALARETSKPIDDTRATGAYRKAMVGALTQKVLQHLVEAKKEAGK